jgi:hypothetical protein
MSSKVTRAFALGFAGLLSIAALASFTAAGCSTETCVGGVVVNGKCEGKCDPSKCQANNTCVANRCELQCTKPADCIAGQQDCVAKKNDAGQDVSVCEYAVTKSADIGTSCPLGSECDALMACPDGSSCGPDVAKPNCDAAHCKALYCVGGGVGDADAYCANLDCASDSDCATGYTCSVIRLKQKICGTTKGTDDPCLDPADFNKDGATFSEGPISLLRKACRKRVSCQPCKTDDDCSLVPGQACVQIGASDTFCAKSCNTSKDCEDDHTCGGGFCVPKTGSCTGSGKFCEPCNTDLDCAAGGPTVACVNATGDQRACFDTKAVNCMTDADCPQAPAPSTRHGKCLDATVGVNQGDPGYHTCYLPYNAGLNKFKCF